VAMQVLVIDFDDSQKKSGHEEIIAFCNSCENLGTHHCKTCDRNLSKFCIIDHYKNTAFTKDHETQKMLMKSTLVCQENTKFYCEKLGTPYSSSFSPYWLLYLY
jgi:hypothetical protein